MRASKGATRCSSVRTLGSTRGGEKIMIEIELTVKCDECGAELDASVHGDIIYVSPCECQKDKIEQLESELEESQKREEER